MLLDKWITHLELSKQVKKDHPLRAAIATESDTGRYSICVVMVQP
jgi:hypothetical protein